MENSPTVSGLVSVQFDDALAQMVEEAIAAGEVVPTKAPGMGNLLQELGIESLERVFPDAGEYEPRTRKLGLHRFYTVVYSADIPATKASASFESMPGVVSAHPLWKIRKRSYPNDPNFSKQWHFYNSSKPGADINVTEVWEKYTTGSDKVIVCVVDEPVDPMHEDLKDNLWTDASGHTGYNYARYSDNWNMSIRTGDLGHGTHVAGTIAAVSNNGKGVAGIAGGDYAQGIPGVKLLSHAIFSGYSSADDDKTARAIKEGADRGAVISQNSWGLYADGILGDVEDGYVSGAELAYLKSLDMDDFPEIKAAVDYFIEYAGCDAQGNQRSDSPMKGGLVFFAAGNEGDLGVDWDPYGVYEPVIAVGSFSKNGAASSFSNYGSWVDVAAPGGDYGANIWSTLPNQSGISDTGYGGSNWIGTSMACPHASGVAALIVSYFGKEGFTADDAKAILYGGLGVTIGGSKPVGKKIDALASFEWGIANGYGPGSDDPDDPDDPGDPDDPSENHNPTISLSKSSVQMSYFESGVKVTVTASDEDGDKLTLSCEPGSTAVSFDSASGVATLNAYKAAPGKYTATFKATDPSGASATAKLSYEILDNRAPGITASQSSVALKAHESAVIYFSVSDEDDDEVDLDIKSTGSEAAVYDKPTKSLRITASKAKAGSYIAVLEAKDSPLYTNVEAKTTTLEVHYTILKNHAPTVSKYIADMSQAGLDPISIVNGEHFVDTDGETLRYSVTVEDTSIATSLVTGSTTVITPRSYGVTTVTITATDGLEASESISFKVAFTDPQHPVTVENQEVTNALTLHIGTSSPTNVEVLVYNTAGNQVLRNVFTASVFYPVQMDVSSLAPGRYIAKVKYSSKTNTVKFVKY